MKAHGQLYYCGTTNRKVEIPPPVGKFQANPFVIGRSWPEFTNPVRWTETYGWMAFIPLKQSFAYPFHVLSHIPNLIYDEKTKLYQLPENTIASWNALSTNIRFACLRLRAVYKTNPVPPYPPQGWWYENKYASARKAMRFIERGRQWFQVWWGHLTYLVARAESEVPREKESARPHWRTVLLDAGLPMRWVDALEPDSWIPEPKLGAVFDDNYAGLQQQRMGYSETAMALCRVYKAPVWYLWNEDSLLFSKNRDEDDLPPRFMREPALQGVITENEVDTQAMKDHYEKKKARVEWIAAKMKEVEALEEQHQARESQSERQRRLARTKMREVKRARMTLWEPDPKDRSRLVPRQIITQNEKGELLDDHASSQTRYFPSLNVWHVCDDLDPDWLQKYRFGGADDDDDEDYDEDDYRYDEKAPEFPEPTAPVPDPETQVSKDLVPIERFQNMHAGGDAEDNPLWRHLRGDLIVAMGYVAPIPLPLPEDIAHWKPPQQEITVFFRAMGRAFYWHRKGAEKFMRSEYAQSAWALYKAFTSPRLEDTMSTPCFDLNPTCPMPLHTELLEAIRIHERPGEPTMYIFHISGPFKAAVYCPTVALAVCRDGCKTFEDIVWCLYNYGAPFQTLERLKAKPKPFVQLYPPRIPERPRNYDFQPRDYEEYVAGIAREMFSKGRGAVLRGGYIWRLSCSFLVVSDALNGPSGRDTVQVEWNEDYWGDDRLTAIEEAIIVGTYNVDNGRGGFNQVSWWPPVDLYEGERCGENYGCWTDYNETGFLEREERIRRGEAKPLSRQDWKRKLHGISQTRQWKKHLQKRSEAYIREVIGRSRNR